MDVLSEKVRPEGWSQFVGHPKVVRTLVQWIQAQSIPHLVFVGPPGSGKTSLAQILSRQCQGQWINSNASDFSSKEVRSWIAQARELKTATGEKTFIFFDEIHRLTKTQQDILLEPLEKYYFNLVGATTENLGSFLSPAFLSRIRVLRLQPLSDPEVLKVLEQATRSEAHLDLAQAVTPQVLQHILASSRSDLRKALGQLAVCLQARLMQQEPVSWAQFKEIEGFDSSPVLSEIETAEALSAFIKSIRASEPDAAVLWMTQLLESGVDPRVIARRLVIAASEDIGNAEPRALAMAVAAAQASDLVGPAEIPIVLSQATIFLAAAPKSNVSYQAVKRAQELVHSQGPFRVPRHLTAQGKDQYQNPHEAVRGHSQQSYWPRPDLEKLVKLSERGFEKKLQEYLNWIHGVKDKNLE